MSAVVNQPTGSGLSATPSGAVVDNVKPLDVVDLASAFREAAYPHAFCRGRQHWLGYLEGRC
jgi:hypothetical protein